MLFKKFCTRFGWVVELIKSHYINVLTYRPLSGSYYVKLDAELKSPKKKTKQHQK